MHIVIWGKLTLVNELGGCAYRAIICLSEESDIQAHEKRVKKHV